MEWIRGFINFPKRVRNVVVETSVLEKYNLNWAKPPVLTEKAYCIFLEGLFLYLKKSDLIPKDSQLWAAGRRWDMMGICLTIESEEFEPILVGSTIPCSTIEFLRKKRILAEGEANE